MRKEKENEDVKHTINLQIWSRNFASKMSLNN